MAKIFALILLSLSLFGCASTPLSLQPDQLVDVLNQVSDTLSVGSALSNKYPQVQTVEFNTEGTALTDSQGTVLFASREDSTTQDKTLDLHFTPIPKAFNGTLLKFILSKKDEAIQRRQEKEEEENFIKEGQMSDEEKINHKMMEPIESVIGDLSLVMTQLTDITQKTSGQYDFTNGTLTLKCTIIKTKGASYTTPVNLIPFNVTASIKGTETSTETITLGFNADKPKEKHLIHELALYLGGLPKELVDENARDEKIRNVLLKKLEGKLALDPKNVGLQNLFQIFKNKKLEFLNDFADRILFARIQTSSQSQSAQLLQAFQVISIPGDHMVAQ